MDQITPLRFATPAVSSNFSRVCLQSCAKFYETSHLLSTSKTYKTRNSISDRKVQKSALVFFFCAFWNGERGEADSRVVRYPCGATNFPHPTLIDPAVGGGYLTLANVKKREERRWALPSQENLASKKNCRPRLPPPPKLWFAIDLAMRIEKLKN